MKYNGYDDSLIHDINNKLYHLAVVNGSFKYLELNSLPHSEKNSRKITQSALACRINYAIQNYQTTSALQFIKFVDFPEAVDKNLPKGDFQQSEFLMELT